MRKGLRKSRPPHLKSRGGDRLPLSSPHPQPRGIFVIIFSINPTPIRVLSILGPQTRDLIRRGSTLLGLLPRLWLLTPAQLSRPTAPILCLLSRGPGVAPQSLQGGRAAKNPLPRDSAPRAAQKNRGDRPAPILDLGPEKRRGLLPLLLPCRLPELGPSTTPLSLFGVRFPGAAAPPPIRSVLASPGAPSLGLLPHRQLSWAPALEPSPLLPFLLEPFTLSRLSQARRLPATIRQHPRDPRLPRVGDPVPRRLTSLLQPPFLRKWSPAKTTQPGPEPLPASQSLPLTSDRLRPRGLLPTPSRTSPPVFVDLLWPAQPAFR